jgi:hypothetical protein
MPAARARFAFARKTDAHAVFDTRWNFDRQSALLPHPAQAAAFLAGRLNNAADALTGRAGAFDREKSLLRAHAALAFAHRAICGIGTGRSAGAFAVVASDGIGNRDLLVDAGEGFLERDVEIVAQIGAAHGALLLLRTAPTAQNLAEHFVENIGKARAEFEAAETGAGAHAALLERRMAETVVSRAALIVAQHVIGLVDFLEFVLGLVITRVAIGMIFHRLGTIAFLKLVGGSAALRAQ